MPDSGSEYFLRPARCLWHWCCITQPLRNNGKAMAVLICASTVKAPGRSFCRMAAVKGISASAYKDCILEERTGSLNPNGHTDSKVVS